MSQKLAFSFLMRMLLGMIRCKIVQTFS